MASNVALNFVKTANVQLIIILSSCLLSLVLWKSGRLMSSEDESSFSKKQREKFDCPYILIKPDKSLTKASIFEIIFIHTLDYVLYVCCTRYLFVSVED